VFWLLCIFWIHRLMTKYKILDLKGGLPIFLFVLFSFTFFKNGISLDILLSILFLLFSFEQLIIIYQTQGRLYQSLNLGFLFGSAVFFYFPLALLFPWLIMALGIYKNLKWRDFILPLLGALIPFYIYSTICFFYHQPNILFTKMSLGYKFPNSLGLLVQKDFLFDFVLMIYFLVLFYSFKIKDTLTIKNRMFYNVLLLLFLGIVLLALFGADSLVELSFLLLTITFLGAAYFNTYKKAWVFDVLMIAYWSIYFLS